MNEPRSRTPNTHEIGNEGEELAWRHLRDKGYRLLDRNFRVRQGELDLVLHAPDGDIVFAEVKTSRGDEAGDPAGWVNGRKQRRLQRMARWYAHRKGLEDKPMRFDVVTVQFGGSSPLVRHIEHAFLPDLDGYY